MAKAYGELVRDGVLESLQGKGFFVAEKRQIYSKAERLRRLRHAADAFIHEAVFLDFSAEEIRAAVDEKLAAAGMGDQKIRSLKMIPSEFLEPAQDDPVIRASGLTRYFGRKCAVDSVTFDVPRGSVFAFIGRNGAGKTTTIRMILGLLEPTRGSARILGHDSAALPPEARARIGYMAEGHPVYGWMRVGQYAGFQRGFYPHWNQDIFAGVIDYFAIDPRTKAGHLSHGQRAGLHLAMTLAIEPEILMLDDPATGLDPPPAGRCWRR